VMESGPLYPRLSYTVLLAPSSQPDAVRLFFEACTRACGLFKGRSLDHHDTIALRIDDVDM
jgi:hypothetical protein